MCMFGYVCIYMSNSVDKTVSFFTGQKHHDIGLGNDLLDMKPKAQKTKEKKQTN